MMIASKAESDAREDEGGGRTIFDIYLYPWDGMNVG